MDEGIYRQPYRFVILALACALAFVGNYLQYQVSALATDVMGRLHIGTAEFQLLFLVPMLAAVFFSIPFGVLGDKVGPKKVIACAFLVTLAGSVARFVDLQSFPLQVACMFMMGVGMSALTANNAKTLGLWFGARTDFAMGFYYAFSCLGISVSQATASMFGSTEGSYLFATMALCVVILCWLCFDRNVPKGGSVPSDAMSKPTFGPMLRVRNVWLIAFAAGLTLSTTTGYAGILPQALELSRGMETTVSGQMASFLTLASMAGCIATPVLCARFKTTKVYLVVAGIVGTFVMALTWMVPDSGMALLAMMLLNGFTTNLLGPILQSLPIVLPDIGSRFAGSAGGIIGEVSLMFSFALPIVISAISGFDYTMNLTLLSLCYGLSLVPIAFLPRLNEADEIAR
ncbi:MAG: MFS transporter [Coriobacteriales bacterium]